MFASNAACIHTVQFLLRIVSHTPPLTMVRVPGASRCIPRICFEFHFSWYFVTNTKHIHLCMYICIYSLSYCIEDVQRYHLCSLINKTRPAASQNSVRFCREREYHTGKTETCYIYEWFSCLTAIIIHPSCVVCVVFCFNFASAHSAQYCVVVSMHCELKGSNGISFLTRLLCISCWKVSDRNN